MKKISNKLFKKINLFKLRRIDRRNNKAFCLKNLNKPIVYYLCPENNKAIGGIKIIYRHVDILNKNKIPSAVLHKTAPFKCTWFENKTNICYENFIKIKPIDIIVVPEVYGPELTNFYPGIKKVIFNQNAHLTFGGYSLDKNDHRCVYLHSDTIGVYCISEHIFQYLKYTFPKLKIFRGRNGIDGSIFKYNSNKEKIISLMPRKLPGDSRNLINILKFKNLINDFDIYKIDKLSEKDVGEILGRSIFFLSFSDREGLPLPPMEAMSCGCVVIGYDGIGGREYFKNDFCYSVENSNILSFAKEIEQVIRIFRNSPNEIITKGKLAHEFIKTNYSLEKEEADIITFWSEVLS